MRVGGPTRNWRALPQNSFGSSDPLTLSFSLREREPSTDRGAAQCSLSGRERDRVRGSDDITPPPLKQSRSGGTRRLGARLARRGEIPAATALHGAQLPFPVVDRPTATARLTPQLAVIPRSKMSATSSACARIA